MKRVDIIKTLDCARRIVLPFAAAVACSGGSSSGGGNPIAPPPGPVLPSTFAGKIVFQRGGVGLMVMNADGSGVAPLGVVGHTPDISPDGRRLAYTNNRDLRVLDLTTGRDALLASGGTNQSAKWSPDGTRILFWSDRTGVKQIYVANADGTSPRALTSGAGEHHEGDWSPDGTRIAFRRVGEGDTAGDIWVMNADGTGQARLVALAGQQTNPDWSPDGSRIAFDSIVRDVPGGPANVEIFVVNADGTNLVRATTTATADWAPRWSPDGTRIAFFGYPTAADGINILAGADSDIYTVRADGTGLAPFLAGPTADETLAFGPRP